MKQSGIIVEQGQLSADPSSPASGYSVLYPKTDGDWYIKSPGGGVGKVMTNPMTTAEDLIIGGSSGLPTRLAVGSNGEVLTIVGGAVEWAPAAGIPAGGTAGQILAKVTNDDYDATWIPYPTLNVYPGDGILIDGENNISIDDDYILSLVGPGVTDGDKGEIIVSSSGASWVLDSGISVAKLADGSISNTEFQYLNGLTGNIQAQLDEKQRNMRYFNIEDYGATTSGDATTAIQAAINAAQTAGGGVVFMPRGTWSVSDTITISHSDVVLQGSGPSTHIQASGNYGNILEAVPPTVPAVYADVFHNVWFRDFRISSLTDMTSGWAIYTNYTHSTVVSGVIVGNIKTIENPGVSKIYAGVAFDNESNAVLSNSELYPWKYGVRFTGVLVGDFFLGTNCFDGLITGNTFILGDTSKWEDDDETYGVWIAGGIGGVQVESCNLSFFNQCIRVDRSINDETNYSIHLKNGFAADNSGGHGIYIAPNSLWSLDMTGGWASASGNAHSGKSNIYLDTPNSNTLIKLVGADVHDTQNSGHGMTILDGRLIVSGCFFYRNPGKDIILGTNVLSATITSNDLEEIQDDGASNLTIFGNSTQLNSTNTPIRITEADGGSASAAYLQTINNSGKYLSEGITSSGFTANDLIGANTAFIQSNAPGGLAFTSNHTSALFKFTGVNPDIHFHSTDYANPFTFAGGLSDMTAARLHTNLGNRALNIQGFANSASMVGLSLQGHAGSEDPTAPAIVLEGFKLSGSGRGTLASDEPLLMLVNGDYSDLGATGYTVFVINGDGHLTITTPPDGEETDHVLTTDAATGHVRRLPISSIGGGLDETLEIGNTSARQLRITGILQTDSQASFGTLEFQTYVLNNAWIGENIYYNTTTGMTRRQDGAAAMLYYAGTEMQFRIYESGTSGSSVTDVAQFKVGESGDVGIGGIISPTAGDFTGAKLYISGDTGTVYFANNAMMSNTNAYLNFNYGGGEGSSGYGFRDNAGTMQFKNYEGSWTNFGSGGGTPGGSDTHVQYNNSGSFAGDDGLTFNGSNELSIGNTTNPGYLKLKHATASGAGIVGESAGTATFQLGIGNTGLYGGTTDNISGREFTIYDYVTSKMRLGLNASGDFFVGESNSTFSLMVKQDGELSAQGLNDGTGVDRMVITNNGTLSYANIPSGGGGFTDPLTTNGDIIARISGATNRLAAGTAGYVLTSNGAGNNISWQAMPGSGQDAVYTTVYGTTSGTTPVLLTGSMIVTNGEAGLLEFTVYAINSTSSSSFTQKIIYPYLANSSTSVLFGTPDYMIAESGVGLEISTASIDIDDNGSGDVVVTAIGVSGQSINWRVEIKKYVVVWSS